MLNFTSFPIKSKSVRCELNGSSLTTSIFYESPKRIKSTISFCSEIINSRKISIVRELTKKNEEIINGDIIDVKNLLDKKGEIKGEITIIIEPTNKKSKGIDDLFLIKKIEKEFSKNKPLSQISIEISDTYNVSKRRVYQLCLGLKDKF